MNTEIELKYTVYDYLDAVWRRRYFFAASLICMPIIALLISQILPKKYEAESAIAVYNTAPPSMKDLNYAPVIDEQFASLAAHITSPSVLKKIALQVGMMDPETGVREGQMITDDLAKAITVTYVEKNLVKIKLVENKPDNMVTILNMIDAIVIEQLQEPLTRATQASKEFLKKEIDREKEALRVAIDQLKIYEAQHSDYLPSYEGIYMGRFQTVSADLTDKKAQYQALLAQKKELQTSLLKVNPILGSLSKAILDNSIQLSKMRLIYKDSYAGVQDAIQLDKSLREQRAKIYKQFQELSEENIQEMWEATISASSANKQSGALLSAQLQNFQNIKLRLKGLSETIANLSAQKNDLTYKLNKVTEAKQQWITLNRAVKEHQKLYDDLVSSYVMTKGTSGFNSAEQSLSVKVVSYPQTPFASTQRPRIFFILVGIAGGFTLGGALTAVFELMDNSVRRRRVIEALTGIMVICRVEKMVTK